MIKMISTAIPAVIIALIKSPTPARTHTCPFNCATPLPTKVALATTTVASGLSLNLIAMAVPIKAGIVNWML